MSDQQHPYLDRARVSDAQRRLGRALRTANETDECAQPALRDAGASREKRARAERAAREASRTGSRLRAAYTALGRILSVLDERDSLARRAQGLLDSSVPLTSAGARARIGRAREELELAERVLGRVLRRLEETRADRDRARGHRDRLARVVERAKGALDQSRQSLAAAQHAVRMLDQIQDLEAQARHTFAEAARARPDLLRLLR